MTVQLHSIVTGATFKGAKVDREKRQILGFVVTSIGPALGHGEQIDEESLRQVVLLGNGGGVAGAIRARMDHPPRGDMTVENPLEKMLGRPVNFRTEGGRVLADLQLLSAAAAPAGDRLMSLAEEAPDLFGASLVFEYADPESHMSLVKKGKNPPVRFGTILAVDFVDLPATNPSGLFSAKPQAKENLMAGKCAAYVRNGGLFGSMGGEEFEIVLPSEATGAKGGDDDGDEGEKKDKAGKHGATTVDVDAIKADAVKAEREYAANFHTAMTTAGLKDKAAEEFRTTFYGRKIDDVKFLASHAIGARAKPVGEGGGGDGGETDAQKTEKAEKEFQAHCAKTFAENAGNGEPRYRFFGVKTSDPESPEYKAGLQKFIRLERKQIEDAKRAATAPKA